MRRAFDIAFAAAVLIVVSPLLALAAIGIRLASPGPILFDATRVGRDGVPFSMLKFRTMHVSQGGPVITAHRDPRIFGFGRFLRASKIDELPQFLNVLRGDMSVVGPRPEDPKIVADAYTDWMRETLAVRPGITSPGALFYYAYGEQLVSRDDPEGSYIAALLPPKLAIERAYIERATLGSDIAVVLRTFAAIIGIMANRPVPPRAEDIAAAARWWPIATVTGYPH